MNGGQLTVTVQGYRDLERIGSGASSVVYRALQVEFDRTVALKVLNADDADDPARKRFAREKTIIGRLGSHPHVVQVFEAAFTADGRPYVAMQLYDGSAQDRLAAVGSFAVDEAIEIMAAIAGAAQAAHDLGVLHRDIKPQNVLLSRYGPGLADFGIARSAASLDQSLTLASLTPWHAAPEAFDDAEMPTVQGDVWSLGSTLYTLLAGRPPFAGSASESILKYQVRVAREPLPHIPRDGIVPELKSLLESAMAKDPGDRPATAAEFRSALLGIGNGPRPSASFSSGLLEADRGTSPASIQPIGGFDSGTTISREEGGERVRGEASPPSPVGIPTGSDAVAGGLTVEKPTGPEDLKPLEPEPGSAARPQRAVAAVGLGVLAIVVAVSVVIASGGKGDSSDDATPITVPDSVPSAAIVADLAPADFEIEDFGESAQVFWNDSSEGISPHILVIEPDDGSAGETRPIPPGETSSTFRELDPTVGYCFRLVAVTADGGGRSEEVRAELRDGCAGDL